MTPAPAALAEALLAVGVAASRPGELADRLNAICEAMTNTLRCDRSSVLLLDGDELRGAANHGNPPDIAALFAETRFRVGHPLMASVLNSDEPLHIGDAAGAPHLISAALVRAARIHSIIAAPIVSSGRSIGVITAEFDETNAEFAELDSVVVEGLAKIASLIVDEHHARTREAALLDEIRWRSEHDELTGLPNRRSLTGWFESAVSSYEPDAVIAVVLADLDRVKLVNDTLGHTAGDRLLVVVADRLRDSFDAPDVLVSRFGGDEFVVCAVVDDLDHAERIAGRISEALEDPIYLSPAQPVVTTASVGIAVSKVADLDPETLLSDADAAMYVAKNMHRGGSVLARSEHRPMVSRRLALESSLPRAINEAEVVPWFQPIVELTSGRCVAVEMLARWDHPDRGVLGPEHFLPSVAEMGLLRELTDSILCQSAEVLRHSALSDITVCLNTSVSDIDEHLIDRLHENFPDPDRLTIELTERDAMHQATDVVGILHRVRESGIRVALDDFGTGYSSMSMLGQLPLDIVKIDQSLIAGMRQARTSEVVRSVVRLGKALGLTVLAEGVEDELDVAELAAAGVELAQGFLYGRAMPLADLVTLSCDGGAGIRFGTR